MNDDLWLRRLTCGKASPFRRACILKNLSAQSVAWRTAPRCTRGSESAGKPEAFPSADGLLYESLEGIQSVSTAHVVQRRMLHVLSATQDGLYSPEGGRWRGVEAR